MQPRRLLALLIACLLLAAAGCGGGDDDSGDSGAKSITFWSAEDNADRVKVLQGIVDDFQQKSGVQVKLVTIAEDQLASQIQSASAAGTLPDVMGSLSLGFAHSLAADDLADSDAANAVIESLGRDTFSSGPWPWSTATASRSASRRHLGPAAGLPQGPVRQGGAGDARHLREDPGRGEQAQHVGHGRDRRRHQGRRRVHPADLRVLRPRQRLPARRRPGQRQPRLAAVRGDVQVLQRPHQELLVQGRPGRRHHPGRLLRRQGRDDHLVVVPARRDGRPAQRRPADLHPVQGRPGFLAKNSGVVTAIKGPDGTEPVQFGEVTS